MNGNNYSKDERIERIYNLLIKYTTLDFSQRETISDKSDELDAIITGLNTLGEELEASRRNVKAYETRVGNILEVLLEYTLMDFSRKAEVSEAGDELDAIAVGLNTLSEELEASREMEKLYIKDLKESEDRFRLLVENVKDYAFFMVDANGYVASWNQGVKLIEGYSEEEVLGKHISIFFTKEEIEIGTPEYCLKTAKEKGSYENEGWRLRKDGLQFWAAVVFTALYDEAGNLYGYSKVIHDITEKKKSNEKFICLTKS